MEAPWAMQFVVRVERADPPRHSDVCELTATATMRLLADVRAALRAVAPVEIVDAGYTVVAPNTTTALARWA